MTTPRIQVLLRPGVFSLVKQRSEEQGTTLSKTVSQLVELALEAEGLYDRKAQSSQAAKNRSMGDFISQAAASGREVEVIRKTEQLDQSDIELLNKIKALKAVGLF